MAEHTRAPRRHGPMGGPPVAEKPKNFKKAMGKLIHLALHREVSLRTAKATERASIRMIGEYRP